ncbi:MAG TPA: response regulator [Thermodesulfovibrionales bacterium]|nr:response regulator [Thermodesulfovibrionales bacterium]
MEKKELRILIADDDDIVRDAISSLLTDEGYSVLSAVDGIDAISVLRIQDIDLVITDLRMPGADGYEVLRYAVKSNPDITVIMLTAYGTLDTALNAIKDGAYDYLTKPFKIQEILLLVEKVFRRAQLIQENRELKKSLRDAYRDINLIRTVIRSSDPGIATSWIDKIETLKSANAISYQDAEFLKERLIRGYE